MSKIKEANDLLWAKYPIKEVEKAMRDGNDDYLSAYRALADQIDAEYAANGEDADFNQFFEE